MKIIKQNFNFIENFTLVTSLMEEKNIYYIKSCLYNKCKKIDYILTPGVTENKKEAVRLYELICENGVFPCQICSVLDENQLF